MIIIAITVTVVIAATTVKTLYRASSEQNFILRVLVTQDGSSSEDHHSIPGETVKFHSLSSVINMKQTLAGRRRVNVAESPKKCVTSDPNTDVKAIDEDISTLSLSVMSQNSSHIFKSLISTSIQKNDFIVEIGGVESTIPQSDKTAFDPNVVIVPTDVNITGTTGNSVPLVGSCTIPVKLSQGTPVDCNFLVSTSEPSIIGLQFLRSLRASITLMTSVDVNELKQLILKCSKATGGMRITKCVTPVESSDWAAPIVTPPKTDGITPSICGDYRLTLNTQLLQLMNTITKDLDGVEMYQDDVIVHAANKATHDMRLLSLLNRFSEFNVAIHPVTCETFQRVHADYCGPFLAKYYALIVIDALSRLPEVFLTTSPSAEFTQQALRKVFSRDSAPTVLVTDNGIHFAAKSLEEWLKGLGCRYLFTAPRHPQSNRIAENFIRTLKSAMTSFYPTTFVELDRGIDNFLMQYRNVSHSATGKSPAFLFKSHSLRTIPDCAKTADVTFFKGNDLHPVTGIILSLNDKRMVTILDLDDRSCHRRHIDQVEFNTRGRSVNGTTAVSNTNESFVDDLMVSEQNVISEENTTNEEAEVSNLRRSGRLRSRPPLNYKHPHTHSRCGDAGISGKKFPSFQRWCSHAKCVGDTSRFREKPKQDPVLITYLFAEIRLTHSERQETPELPGADKSAFPLQKIKYHGQRIDNIRMSSPGNVTSALKIRFRDFSPSHLLMVVQTNLLSVSKTWPATVAELSEQEDTSRIIPLRSKNIKFGMKNGALATNILRSSVLVIYHSHVNHPWEISTSKYFFRSRLLHLDRCSGLLDLRIPIPELHEPLVNKHNHVKGLISFDMEDPTLCLKTTHTKLIDEVTNTSSLISKRLWFTFTLKAKILNRLHYKFASYSLQQEKQLCQLTSDVLETARELQKAHIRIHVPRRVPVDVDPSCQCSSSAGSRQARGIA
ncbi:hypothetical protein CLF_112823 [Clonorchis sinensis]|uniref:Integrase catalytic domain-containing protein n=1 Tax=Clonorchis sinensis TaxID=79923 RepID=G7YX29_CLOSI|nr:hypothetical protein CLF_112823 [Clonorchis sinensis]